MSSCRETDLTVSSRSLVTSSVISGVKYDTFSLMKFQFRGTVTYTVILKAQRLLTRDMLSYLAQFLEGYVTPVLCVTPNRSCHACEFRMQVATPL